MNSACLNKESSYFPSYNITREVAALLVEACTIYN